jgi:uncharacterized cofD-like protein
MNKKQKIVTIGGGTGSFVLLSGLKKLPVEISAIVSMADDGGSTGILRDELGVLPPGDVRQCLVALAHSSEILRELFNFRYANGKLDGHSFGNIFLSTLEKITGNFIDSIKEAGKILRIRGKVIPVTLTNTKLIADLKSGLLIKGQCNIGSADLSNLKKMYLQPRAKLNPDAAEAIKQADKIIINPGNLFASVIPCLLVDGLPEAIRKSRAKKIYVCNLMTKLGQTNNYTVLDFLEKIEEYLGKGVISYVIYNRAKLGRVLIKKYLKNKEDFVELGDYRSRPDVKFISKDLLSKTLIKPIKGDRVVRTLVRHDSEKLAKIIYNL